MNKFRFRTFRTSAKGFGLFYHNLPWLKGTAIQIWNYNFCFYWEDKVLRNAIVSGGDFS